MVFALGTLLTIVGGVWFAISVLGRTFLDGLIENWREHAPPRYQWMAWPGTTIWWARASSLVLTLFGTCANRICY
jgi:hypothetical protein